MYNDYILVKKLADDKSEGITYASAVDDFIYKGEVVQSDYIKPTVGATVLFIKGAGEDVTIKGEHYKCVKVEDIIMELDGE